MRGFGVVMKLQDWQNKLIAHQIDGDSVKKYRTVICRNHGFRSVADIPYDMADDLVEMIASYIESALEINSAFGCCDEWWK